MSYKRPYYTCSLHNCKLSKDYTLPEKIGEYSLSGGRELLLTIWRLLAPANCVTEQRTSVY